MAKPDIVFVPGFWEGSSAFDHCARLLREADYTVHTASLLSTGVPFTEHPKSPSLHDDVNHIRSLLENLIRLDRELVLVLHSAGGFLGSHAIEGLSATIRAKNAQKGGVVHLAFVAGGVCPEGTVHQDLPFFEVEVCSRVPSGAERITLTRFSGRQNVVQITEDTSFQRCDFRCRSGAAHEQTATTTLQGLEWYYYVRRLERSFFLLFSLRGKTRSMGSVHDFH